MTPTTPTAGNGDAGREPDFSIVLGGPLYQLLRRAHLADDAMDLVRRRIVVLSLLAWLPLLVLAAVEGNLTGGPTAVPFVRDIEVHVRFLAAMPMLIAAELIVHQRMRPLLQVFRERRLIPESAKPQFEAAVEGAFRLRNSVWVEVFLIALVYGLGVLVIWRRYMSLEAATWYATPSASGSVLSMAGAWYGYVSLPVFQFLLVRWLFRLFLWTRLLWKISRIELHLVPTHPDRVGGLSFLSGTTDALVLIAAALGTLLAGQIANRIFYLGAALPAFKAEIAVTLGFLVIVIQGPLLFFAGQLARAKRIGTREYGTLAERYVCEFDEKWIRGGAPAGEALVGSADIQSLADLGNSFEVVRSMRTVPITRDGLVHLAVATLLPILPLALTMMPLEDLLKTLLGVVF
jgi:hypothetical protein